MADQNSIPTEEPALTSYVRPLTIPEGLYLFYVRSVASKRGVEPYELNLPAFQVSLAPGVASDQAELIPGPRMKGTWLYEPGSMLIARIFNGPATLLLTSLQAEPGPALDIKVERLDARVLSDIQDMERLAVETAGDGKLAQTKASPARRDGPQPPAPKPASHVPFQLVAHVRNRGDMSFAPGAWAGRLEKGMWIESFNVTMLGELDVTDIEYKSLTGNGIETPWIQGGQACGTRGMGIPLVGFALRLKPAGKSVNYDCEYSGYFQSGATIGPLKNGAPCRSTVAADPLEGMQIRIVPRLSAVAATNGGRAAQVAGPRFTKLREDAVASKPTPASTKTLRKKRVGQPAKPVSGKAVRRRGRTASKTSGQSLRPAAGVSRKSQGVGGVRPGK